MLCAPSMSGMLLYLYGKYVINMYKVSNDISIERLLELELPEMIGYHKDLVMTNTLGDMKLFSHPVRLKATTVLVCLDGEIDCSVNLRRFKITKNQLLINFATDIIHIHNADNITGYAILLSEEYMKQLQLDFRLKAQRYVDLRNNGPVSVPYEELKYLKPYYELFKKNIEDGNADVIQGLALALTHTILSMVRRFHNADFPGPEGNTTRAQQIFDRFMSLLQAYHDKERSLQFYADKMFLSPKYFSGVVKGYSGRAVLDWINEYVILEARMMLRYTPMSVQEIAYALNFPTQSAFGKYFKKQVGVSPKQYRCE